MKFKDLKVDRVQIIRKDFVYYNVLTIKNTLIHQHPFVCLLRLNWLGSKGDWDVLKLYEEDFNILGFKEVCVGVKQ